jgi:hypothetical protein
MASDGALPAQFSKETNVVTSCLMAAAGAAWWVQIPNASLQVRARISRADRAQLLACRNASAASDPLVLRKSRPAVSGGQLTLLLPPRPAAPPPPAAHTTPSLAHSMQQEFTAPRDVLQAGVIRTAELVVERKRYESCPFAHLEQEDGVGPGLYALRGALPPLRFSSHGSRIKPRTVAARDGR